ncbi:MAG TPA: hypothetical protein VE289_03925 [Gaiellaceae bacterium]|nr:hypothetical protein [Gaiellaceae bacterium]
MGELLEGAGEPVRALAEDDVAPEPAETRLHDRGVVELRKGHGPVDVQRPRVRQAGAREPDGRRQLVVRGRETAGPVEKEDALVGERVRLREPGLDPVGARTGAQAHEDGVALAHLRVPHREERRVDPEPPEGGQERPVRRSRPLCQEEEHPPRGCRRHVSGV